MPVQYCANTYGQAVYALKLMRNMSRQFCLLTLSNSCSLSDITKKQYFFELKASPMHFVCYHQAADCWEYMLLS